MRLKKCPMCKLRVPNKIKTCPVCGTQYTKFQYFRINYLSKCILILVAVIILINSLVILFFNRALKSYIEKPPTDIKQVERLKNYYNHLSIIQKYFIHDSEFDIIENSFVDKNKIEKVEDHVCDVRFSHGLRRGVYSGDLYESQPHGQGRFVYAVEDGSVCTYEGEFVDGAITGLGILTFDDGTKYMGTFDMGELDGKAAIYNSEGYKIKSGQFISGKMNGIGAIYDNYGEEIYSGRFIADIPHKTEYKESCSNVTFAQLEANSESYVNKNVKISGVITDVAIQEDMTVLYVMKIAGNNHKNICFDYIGEHGVNIRQGDNMTFYGYFEGYRPFVNNSGLSVGGMLIKTYYAE